jgi:hypothetical protein
MNPSRSEPIVTQCAVRDFQPFSSIPPTPRCVGPKSEFPRRSVEEQIIDFVDGKTDGGDLLHRLYDHVLDERIPERMRSLFRK